MTAEGNTPLKVVLGPTASGKSEYAQHLAEDLGGHVLSADSMQIYKGMDIGTAKVMPQDRTVQYHGLDLVDPGVPYSAALYQEYGRGVIDSLAKSNIPCVVCGGTGFYIQALVYEMDFPKGAQEGNEARDRYEAYAKEFGALALHELLLKRDPDSAALIHPNNVRRVVRALELCEQGESYAEGNSKLRSLSRHYPHVELIGISTDPAVLAKRIDARVEAMFEKGLVEEVKTLLGKGFREGLTSPQAIGYKELIPYVDDGCESVELLEKAKGDIKLATRRYAKRQRSFFRRDSSIEWIEV